MILHPKSNESKILQLLYFQENLDLTIWPHITSKTILPYESWFMSKYFPSLKILGIQQMRNYLSKLESYRFVKKNSDSKFYITLKGRRWGYNLIEYIKQIELNELQQFFRFEYLISSTDFNFKLLDVGCGGGASLNAIIKSLKDKNIKVFPIGLDINFDEIIIGKKLSNLFARTENYNLQNLISFVQADAINLPFDGESIDIIFSKLVIYYLDRSRFINEAWRVLKSGGKIIIITPSYKFFLKQMVYLFRQGKFLSAAKHLFAIINGLSICLLDRQWKIVDSYFYSETLASLSKALKKKGFKIILCKYWKSKFSVNPILVIAEKPIKTKEDL